MITIVGEQTAHTLLQTMKLYNLFSNFVCAAKQLDISLRKKTKTAHLVF